jgi:nicotinamide-nucleotide amidase
MTSPDDLAPLRAVAADLLAEMTRRGHTLAVAESLTGGMLSVALTDVAGASAAFRGGVTAYATDLKCTLLGVAEPTVRSDGVVSAPVAAAMAEGARRRLGSTYALGTTGVAGPDPQEGLPPGTVFVAVAGPDGTATERLDLDGDRHAVRDGTCRAALDLLARTLGRPDPGAGG